MFPQGSLICDVPRASALTARSATWDQAPGAAPHSTTWSPGLISWTRESISSNLYAERALEGMARGVEYKCQFSVVQTITAALVACTPNVPSSNCTTSVNGLQEQFLSDPHLICLTTKFTNTCTKHVHGRLNLTGLS